MIEELKLIWKYNKGIYLLSFNFILTIISIYISKILLFSFLLSLIGGLLNFLAIYNNNGLMPVYINYTNYKLNKIHTNKKYGINQSHIHIIDKKKIKFFYLCDIIKFKRSMLSIGDIFSYISIILFGLFFINNTRVLITEFYRIII